jgi:hypothetical protein
MALAHKVGARTAAVANALPLDADDQAGIPFLILVAANGECCGDQGRASTLNNEVGTSCFMYSLYRIISQTHQKFQEVSACIDL